MVEFRDFNQQHTEPPMTKTHMGLTELLAKHNQRDFLRSIADAVMRLMMEADVDVDLHRFCFGQVVMLGVSNGRHCGKEPFA